MAKKTTKKPASKSKPAKTGQLGRMAEAIRLLSMCEHPNVQAKVKELLGK